MKDIGHLNPLEIFDIFQGASLSLCNSGRSPRDHHTQLETPNNLNVMVRRFVDEANIGKISE